MFGPLPGDAVPGSTLRFTYATSGPFPIVRVLARLAPADAAVLVHPSRLVAMRFTEDVRQQLAAGIQSSATTQSSGEGSSMTVELAKCG